MSSQHKQSSNVLETIPQEGEPLVEGTCAECGKNHPATRPVRVVVEGRIEGLGPSGQKLRAAPEFRYEVRCVNCGAI